MGFDPFDPIDPLGKDVPYEIQDPKPLMIGPSELDLASDEVLRRAQEQAAASDPAVYEAITEELRKREMGELEDEPLDSTVADPPLGDEDSLVIATDSDTESSDSSSDGEEFIEDYTETYTSGYKE